VSGARTVSVVFTDIVASTEILSRVGARRMDALLAEHHALLRHIVLTGEGAEIKSTGDGLMAAFSGAGPAMRAAASMQRALDASNRSAEVRFGMRVGVATGDAHARDGDWFGTPVVQAARLCALADPDEILATEATVLVGGAQAPQARRVGALELKGLDAPVQTWQVSWQKEPAAPRVVIAEDAALMREGLSRLLERGGFDVVGQARDAAELLTLVTELRPDVVVTDVRMPPTFADEGIAAAERIAAERPGVGIVVLSQNLEPIHAERLRACRGAGLAYLLKDAVIDVESFLGTARRVAAGEREVGAA